MKNVQSSMPNERPDPATNEKTKSHAIRRWRSFIPRSFVSPEPDNSWIDECPCGQKLPCPHHRGLWREVRYVKPSDPDYASALARHGIPVYSPSVSELKPTPREAPDLNPK
jgi:hypothetical protein